MLKVTGCYKKLGEFELKDISFMLPKGYIMGLIGENGAGKTTLLNLIMGLYKPDQGKINLFGMAYPDDEKQIKNNIGFVTTEELFYGFQTLRKNAAIYGKYYERYDEALLQHYLTLFQLDAGRKYKTLSKGERLKFQLAFALAHSPKLLVLDEPTANFDPDFKEQFLKIITEFVSDGEHSVILATHLTADLEQVADYITFIREGSLFLCMDRETLLDQYRIVCGETYKVKQIDKQRLVGMENSEQGSTALVLNTKYGSRFSDTLQVRRPTIEEIMYYNSKSFGKRQKKEKSGL